MHELLNPLPSHHGAPVDIRGGGARAARPLRLLAVAQVVADAQLVADVPPWLLVDAQLLADDRLADAPPWLLAQLVADVPPWLLADVRLVANGRRTAQWHGWWQMHGSWQIYLHGS